MVTIDPDKSISTFSDVKTAKRVDGNAKEDFGKLFSDLVEEKQAPEGESVSPFAGSGIRPSQFDSPSPPASNAVVDQVQHFLDTMQTYQQKLDDGSTSLREIEPLMNTLAEQSRRLTAIAEHIGSEDALKTIVNQSLTLASVEIATFRSGLYNGS